MIEYYKSTEPQLPPSLREVEIESLKMLLTEAQKELLKHYENEGYEYLFWGYKFSEVENAREEISQLGYDPEDYRIIFVGGGQEKDLFKIFLFRKKKKQKEQLPVIIAFEVKRKKAPWQSRTLIEHKEKIFKMESLPFGKEFYQELKARGFKRGYISAKIDGESSFYHFDGEKGWFYSKKGFLRRFSPLSEKLEEHLKQKGIKEISILGELFAKDPEGKTPFLPFNVSISIIKKPKDKEEEALICFAGYEFLSMSGQNMMKEIKSYSDRMKELGKILGKWKMGKYFQITYSQEVRGVEEVKKFTEKVIDEGFEGIVLFVEEEK